jgi:hypothetical protein
MKAGKNKPALVLKIFIYFVKWVWGFFSGLHGRRKIVLRSAPSAGHFWN